MKLSWSEVFNTNHKFTVGSHISDAIKLVKKTGYKFFTWNDLVFFVNGEDTGIEVKDLK